jgi:hypothetical protein
VRELVSIADAPPLPFYVVIRLVETQVLFTRNFLLWKKEIRARKDEQVAFFPVYQQTQLKELSLYYD